MFAVRRGSDLVLHPGWVSASGLSEFFRSPTRALPVRFRFGTSSELALTVHLPVDWGVVTPESSDSLQSPYGSAHWTCRAKDSLLIWHSGHSFKGDDVAPVHYGQFQQFLDAMQVRDMREIEVGKLIGLGRR